MKTAILRVLTSLGMIAVLSLTWRFFPLTGIPFLVSIITFVLLWEYYRLIFFKEKHLPFFTNPVTVFTVLSFLVYLPLVFIPFFSDGIFSIFFSFISIVFLLAYGLQLVLIKKENALQILGFSIVSLYYIIFPAVLFYIVFSSELIFSFSSAAPLVSKSSSVFMQSILLLCLSVVFLGDIFAWIGGQLIGGKKWVPGISPGKTWAGLFCGTLASGLAFPVGFYFFVNSFFQTISSEQTFSEPFKEIHPILMYLLFFLLGGLGFFIAQTGDLFVSFLKRKASVKDSGCLLPGHGGLLDRLDGFLLAFPFLYVSIILIFIYSSSFY